MTRQLTAHIAHWASTRVELVAALATAATVALLLAAIVIPAYVLSAPASAGPAQTVGTRALPPAIVEPCLSPRGVFCAGPLISVRNHHRTAANARPAGKHTATSP